MGWILLGIFLLILFILAVRLFQFKSRQVHERAAGEIHIDINQASSRLAGAVQIPTLSFNEAGAVDPEPFERFRSFLQTQFPLIHKTLQVEVIAEHSMLFTWTGSEPALAPVLFLAHSDVVPAADEPMNPWTYPPFSGQIADGFIWGRGTLDDKVSAMGIFEAIEYLLGSNMQPARTLMFAMGHDEEVGGLNGAVNIARVLSERNIKPEFILDEGGMVVDGMIGKLDLAVVGIAEKGYLTVKLSVDGKSGHSSQPPNHTAIGKLCGAIARLESNPFPLRSGGVMATMLDYVGPEMPLGMRLILANQWLLGGLINRMLSKQPAMNAMMRTTQAVTRINGGTKDNILPASASAAVNCRILPGESVQSTLAHIRAQITDPEIKIESVTDFCNEPSLISDVHSTSFAIIQKTISQVFPRVIVAPYLTVGGTDTKHYTQLTRQIYRFLPATIIASDLGRMHGRDERITMDSYHNVIRFYIQLMLNALKKQA